MVRDLQSVIGDEAREQILAGRRPPARPRDRLRGRGLERHRIVHPVRRRHGRGADRRRGRRARASTPGATPRRSPPAPAACCTARCQLRAPGRARPGRSRRTRSPPGSTTRARPRARLAARQGRVRYEAVDGRRRRRRRFAAWRAWRGSSRRSSPPTRWRGCFANPGRASTSSYCPGAATRISPKCSLADEASKDSASMPKSFRALIAEAFVAARSSTAAGPRSCPISWAGIRISASRARRVKRRPAPART